MKIPGFVDKVGCVLIVESMRRDLRSLGGFVWKKDLGSGDVQLEPWMLMDVD